MTTAFSGWFLAVWSFGFACVHVAWGLGWRGGVPADAAPIADRPVFLAYDLVAGGLMFAAAPVAVALAAGSTSRLLRRVTLVGSLLALGRGVPALVLDVAGSTYDGVGFGADVWFTVAGAVGLVLLWSRRRDERLEAREEHAATPGARPYLQRA